MMKMVFYPAFFRLRRLGPTTGLVLATLIVFAVTWVLHSYQWFWLLGSFPIAAQDFWFWALLGVLVVVNSLAEARRGRRRRFGRSARSARELAGIALRTAATFTLIALLWSLWTSASVEEWLALLGREPPDWNALLGVAGGAIAATLLLAAGLALAGAARPQPRIPGLTTAVALVGLVLLSRPELHHRLGQPVAAVVAQLRSPELSAADAARLEQGYYEQLLRVENLNSQLWQLYQNKPPQWGDLTQIGRWQKSGDFLGFQLKPNHRALFSGAEFRTNRWGMRDRDYTQQPAPGTVRHALLGSSHVMGSGVADHETFDVLVEQRLARLLPRGYELLNFAVGGYTPPQQLALLERKVLRFDPSTVIYVAHANDPRKTVEHLAETASHGIAIPYPLLRAAVARAGVAVGQSRERAERRLRPHAFELLGWIYREIAATCRRHGIRPVWLYLASPGELEERRMIARIFELARAAGFEILDLSDVYDRDELSAVQVAEWDRHPNALGHRRVADRLEALLRAHTDWLAPPGLARSAAQPPQRHAGGVVAGSAAQAAAGVGAGAAQQ
jgi:hypothetical protein